MIKPITLEQSTVEFSYNENVTIVKKKYILKERVSLPNLNPHAVYGKNLTGNIAFCIANLSVIGGNNLDVIGYDQIRDITYPLAGPAISFTTRTRQIPGIVWPLVIAPAGDVWGGPVNLVGEEFSFTFEFATNANEELQFYFYSIS